MSYLSQFSVSDLAFVLVHYLMFGLLSVSSYLIGRRILTTWVFNSGYEEISVSTSLGAGAIAYLILLVGLIGALYAWLVVSILLLANLLWCYPVWKRWPRWLHTVPRQFRDLPKNRRTLATAIMTIGLLMLMLPVLLLPLYPPTAFDATMYHLPYARAFAEQHSVAFLPYARFPTFPQTNEMLFTLALLVQDDVLAQLCELLLMATLVIAIIGFGKRFFSSRSGWWAAAILMASPYVIWCGTVGYVDMGLTLFAMMTVYGFWIWYHTGDQRWLILAGVFCGLAIGTKYTALFFLLALQVTAFFLALRKQKSFRPLAFGCAAIIIASPWLLRNFYYLRNPVFPYFWKPFFLIFGVGRIDPAQYASVTGELSAYGLGKNFTALLKLPWHLAFNQEAFAAEATMSRIYLFVLPLLICAVIFRPQIRALLALGLAYVLFWFVGAQVLRYLLPAMPIISLASAATLDFCLGSLPFVRRWKTNTVLTAIGFVLLIFPGSNYSFGLVQERGAPPSTQAGRDAYLADSLKSYPAYKLVNSLRGSNYTIYAYRDANMNYFAQGLFIGDWFGPGRYSLVDDTIRNGGALFNQLKALGVNYFLRRAGKWVPEVPDDEFFNKHFKPIFSKPGIDLYELSDRPLQRRAIELLQNPGFEQSNEDHLLAWQSAGSPQIDRSGASSAGGSVAVRCLGASDVFYQSIPVSPEAWYVIGVKARAAGKDQSAKLQVNWLDAQGHFLKEDLVVLTVRPEWKHFERGINSPANAARAIVYLDGLDHTQVWFDDASFSHLIYSSQP